MSTILEKILAVKREEVAALLANGRASTMRALLGRIADLPETRGFANALKSPLPPCGTGAKARNERSGEISLIAEVKKASPSKGLIRPDFDPVEIAGAYERGGASCLSVLTDREFFQGDLASLGAIREAVSLPLLRKDFTIDPLQIYEARAFGADAILLIVSALKSAARLAELRLAAESVGMDALVEVHDAEELALALESGATLIGVNNRNLHTFDVSLTLSEELIPTFPPGTVAVAESGIFTPADVARMGAAGASAVLVGESLMRQPDIEAATRTLLSNSFPIARPTAYETSRP